MYKADQTKCSMCTYLGLFRYMHIVVIHDIEKSALGLERETIGCSAGERKNKKYQHILNNSLKLTILKEALECSTHVPLHIQVKHWVYDIPLTQYHHLP